MLERCIVSGYTAAFVCALYLLSFTTGCVSTGNGTHFDELGLEYQFRELTDPIPNRVHVLRVNLANREIEPWVVIADDPDGDGPAIAALTDPFNLACDESVIAFINTNPWGTPPGENRESGQGWRDGQPVVIHGLAVSRGLVRSPALAGKRSAWFDRRGRLSMGDCPAGTEIADGVGGFQMILENGDVIAQPGGPHHPRTAIGVDSRGKIMWLVVVDGRQSGFSEGMTLHELAGLMKELGCWHATNMDGGGSSIMALEGTDGKLELVNCPSDRQYGFIPRIRPLPMILTIRLKCPK